MWCYTSSHWWHPSFEKINFTSLAKLMVESSTCSCTRMLPGSHFVASFPGRVEGEKAAWYPLLAHAWLFLVYFRKIVRFMLSFHVDQNRTEYSSLIYNPKVAAKLFCRICHLEGRLRYSAALFSDVMLVVIVCYNMKCCIHSVIVYCSGVPLNDGTRPISISHNCTWSSVLFLLHDTGVLPFLQVSYSCSSSSPAWLHSTDGGEWWGSWGGGGVPTEGRGHCGYATWGTTLLVVVVNYQ